MNHLLFKRHRTHTAFKRADAIRMHRLSAREQRVEDQMISRLVEEMDKEQRREFLIQLTNRMQEGQHWQTAAAAVGIQTSQLQERFGVQVSISQINRIRAMLGVSNHAQARKLKKKQ